MAAIAYETLIAYLDGIDAKGNLAADGAPHGVFWKDGNGDNLSLATFKGLTILGNVKIFNDVHPEQSPLYLILQGPWNGRPQMPKTGPYITDAGYSITVNGATITGNQIKADFLDWLQQEFPKAKPTT
jgi:hypothetical protein